MSKLVILTINDTVETIDYTGYDSINNAVGGFIEHFWDFPNTSDTFFSFFCNEEFMLKNDEQFNKFNALAYLICNKIIYGNVAVLVDPDYEKCDDLDAVERGLTEEEVNTFEIYVQTLVNNTDTTLDELHKQYDSNKSHYNNGVTAFNVSREELMEALRKICGNIEQ